MNNFLILSLSLIIFDSVFTKAEAFWGINSDPCSQMEIRYERTINLTTLFSNDGWKSATSEYENLGVPVYSSNMSGCFILKAGYQIKSTKNNAEIEGSLNIKLPEVQYSNIDQFHMQTYMKIIASEKSPNQTEIKLATFVCSGVNKITSYEFSGKVKDFVGDTKSIESQEVQHSHAFVTGIKIKKNQNKRSSIAHEFISEYLSRLDNSGADESEISEGKVEVPSVISTSNTQIADYQVNKTLSTINNEDYGCSENFKSLLNDYNLDLLNHNPIEQNHLKVNFSENIILLNWKH